MVRIESNIYWAEGGLCTWLTGWVTLQRLPRGLLDDAAQLRRVTCSSWQVKPYTPMGMGKIWGLLGLKARVPL